MGKKQYVGAAALIALLIFIWILTQGLSGGRLKDGFTVTAFPVGKADALLLRAADYGENDKIVTLLTAEYGKIAAAMKVVKVFVFKNIGMNGGVGSVVIGINSEIVFRAGEAIREDFV